MRIFHYDEDAVSVAMEEVSASDWKRTVYLPEIIAKAGQLSWCAPAVETFAARTEQARHDRKS